MNLNSLQYFCAVADEKSYTVAAQKMFVSQQTLSNHVLKLEEELGLKLFERTQPLKLTEAGKILYADGRILIAQLDKTEHRLIKMRESGQDELVIGITTSRGAITLADILPEFIKKWPGASIRLKEGNTLQINEALMNGHTDLNVGFEIENKALVHEELIYRDRLVCVVPYEFMWRYLNSDENTIVPATKQKIDTFAACPFIAMNEDTWLGAEFEKCCEASGVTPNVLLKTASMSTLVSLCCAGLGAIVLPEFFIRRRMVFWKQGDWRDSVLVFPLDYDTEAKGITVAYLKDRYLSPQAKSFIEILKDKYCNYL